MTENLHQKLQSIILSNPQADDREIVFQLKQLLYETEMQQSLSKEPKSITELVAENIKQLDGKTSQNAAIKTGFTDIDRTINGFLPGELVVVGGRPGMGKTQFLINLSLNISVAVPVLYVTFELSEFLLTSRIISSISNIPLRNILQQDISIEQKNILFALDSEFTKRKLFIHDSNNSSISSFKIQCMKQIQENGIQVIVVDYLQQLSSYHHRKYREHEVSYICRELKNLAKENNVCVIVASQMSRSVESRSICSKRPMLSDLRDSGAIEQDADKVLFIYRPEYYKLDFEDGTPGAGLAEIIVAKNRNGRLNDVRLRFMQENPNFQDVANDVRPLSNGVNEIAFVSSREALTFAKNRLEELKEGKDVPF